MQTQKKLTRRQFLARLGTGISVVVIGGGIYRAIDQGVFAAAQGAAYEPWVDWRDKPAQGPLRLVQSAILAANPHNIQPWLFHVTENRIDIYADTGRRLGTMDAYNREMVIGIGCALENMLLAAPPAGYTADLELETGTLTPSTGTPERLKLATITLSPAEGQTSPLYAAIPDRHTDRYNYDVSRTIPQSLLDEMTTLAEAEAHVKLFLYRQGTADYELLSATTVHATESIIADEQMSIDSYAWSKQSWEEVQQDRDGIYIDTAGISPALRALVKMLPSTPRSTFDDGWLEGTKATMQNSDILGFVTVRDLYALTDNLNAGRAWQRMHLWATINGLAMQPVNQMPEIVDRDHQLNRTSEIATIMDELTGDSSQRPTFAFRMGYATANVLPSARRPLTDVVL